MKINITIACVLCFLAGCTSTKAIYKNYDSIRNPQNGVNAEAAKIIAQKKLINTEEKGDYRISYPDIKTGPLANKYPNYWFVVFGHNWFEPMSSNALSGSYTELKEKNFLVVIDKRTGGVIFYGEWFPKRENDFDWVFDRRAYNRNDPLVLPPGKPAREMN